MGRRKTRTPVREVPKKGVFGVKVDTAAARMISDRLWDAHKDRETHRVKPVDRKGELPEDVRAWRAGVLKVLNGWFTSDRDKVFALVELGKMELAFGSDESHAFLEAAKVVRDPELIVRLIEASGSPTSLLGVYEHLANDPGAEEFADHYARVLVSKSIELHRVLGFDTLTDFDESWARDVGELHDSTTMMNLNILLSELAYITHNALMLSAILVTIGGPQALATEDGRRLPLEQVAELAWAGTPEAKRFAMDCLMELWRDRGIHAQYERLFSEITQHEGRIPTGDPLHPVLEAMNADKTRSAESEALFMALCQHPEVTPALTGLIGHFTGSFVEDLPDVVLPYDPSFAIDLTIRTLLNGIAAGYMEGGLHTGCMEPLARLRAASHDPMASLVSRTMWTLEGRSATDLRPGLGHRDHVET